MKIEIDRLDHLVLTVASIDATVAFYTRVLGMRAQGFGEGRIALLFGQQKINLHETGRTFEPRSFAPTPGSADLCFLISGGLEDAMAHLDRESIPVIEGPVPRTGANGPILSVYIRDPDLNLIELSVATTP